MSSEITVSIGLSCTCKLVVLVFDVCVKYHIFLIFFSLYGNLIE